MHARRHALDAHVCSATAPTPAVVILTQATLRQYTGEKDEAGLCHGYGKAVFSSGQVYDGDWQHGHMHGQGSVTFPDNQAYDGCIEADSITGSGVGAQGGETSSQHTAWIPPVATTSALVLSQHSSSKSLCTCRKLHDVPMHWPTTGVYMGRCNV